MSITPPKQPMTAEEAADIHSTIEHPGSGLWIDLIKRGSFLAGAKFGRIQGLREAADLIDPRTSYGHQAIERIKKIEEGKA